MPQIDSADEIIHVAVSLAFLLHLRVDKKGRGWLRPFYDWVTEKVDFGSLRRTRASQVKVGHSILFGIEFFLKAMPSRGRSSLILMLSSPLHLMPQRSFLKVWVDASGLMTSEQHALSCAQKMRLLH